MGKNTAFLMAAILTLALGCGDDDSSNANNLTNNGNNANNANNVPNNANNANNEGNLEAQQTANDLFSAVMNLKLVNIVAGATAFEEEGTEGEKPCNGAIGVQDGYGTMDLDYADGSTYAEWQATASLDGCLAMESGSNPPLEFAVEDPSGDGTPDVYTIDGTIAAMTFDEDGFPPVDQEMFPFTPGYDPDAEPTCSNVVLDGIVLEIFAVAPEDEMFTNTEEPYNAGGYTAGTITANCDGRTISCDLNGGAVPLATFSFDAVTASKDRDSICVFQD